MKLVRAVWFFARRSACARPAALWERSVMRNWKHRRGGSFPPFVDPAFADALAGEPRAKGHRKQNYKALQLCRQVQRILTLELAGFGGDEVLRDLYVADVMPAAGSSTVGSDIDPAKCSD